MSTLSEDLQQSIVAALAEEFEVEQEVITPDADIKETLDLDSLSLVDLIALLENTVKVSISAQEIGGIKTFGDLYNFIADKLK